MDWKDWLKAIWIAALSVFVIILCFFAIYNVILTARYCYEHTGLYGCTIITDGRTTTYK